jgi:hypothetical protein
VLTASVPPENVLRELKAYTSRALNARFGAREKRWARHGSKIWLWDAHRLEQAIEYVVRGQGEPMVLYVNVARWPEYMP